MHIWKSAAKSFLSPWTASQEPQPVRTCEDNLEAKSLEWSWLGEKGKEKKWGRLLPRPNPFTQVLSAHSTSSPGVTQDVILWDAWSLLSAPVITSSPAAGVGAGWQTNYLSPPDDPRQLAVTTLPKRWSPGERVEASKLCLLLASEISPSCFWKLRACHLRLPSFETVLMGRYVCKEYEFLRGIQWWLNREGIILSIPQKGFFSLAHLFSESSRVCIYIPTTNRQPSIRISWRRYWVSKWGRNQSDSIVLARSHPGPFFKIIC